MPAKDKIHDAVKNALINDGWIITDDPYVVEHEKDWLYADLAAERMIAAEVGGEKIIVEIKSFGGLSAIQDFKNALGQYHLYLPVFAELAPDHKLYLAISEQAYYTAFQRGTIKLALRYHNIPFFVVDLTTEEIVQWIH